MNDRPFVCDDQQCTPDLGVVPADGENAPPRRPAPTIEVVSDVICPWCYIGKRRLERALDLLGRPAEVKVVWRPFRLNPSMPPGGIERRAYRIAKFGSWERSLALDARVAEAGRGEGIAFAFDRMGRTPNTLDAHRLLWLAGELGVQGGVAESLFRGYFTAGADLDDEATLIALAVGGGVAASDAARLLAGDEGRAEVLAGEAHYKSLGVTGVPCFFLDGTPAFSGAVEPRLLADAIRGNGGPSVTNLSRAHLRVARPTDDLDAVVRFYRDGLGFALLAGFEGHDGFDGAMLGHAGACYHLEFTRKADHQAGRAPTQENLLVFYLPDRGEWRQAVDRLLGLGHRPVPSFNPYWDRNGATFEDPDGYRVVLQNAGWPVAAR